MARVGHFQQQQSVWSNASGNLLTLSKQQLVDGITVDSACTSELMNNGFAFAEKRTSCARKPVTASPQQRGLARIRVPTIYSVQESVTRYKDVSRTGERAPMSAVA